MKTACLLLLLLPLAGYTQTFALLDRNLLEPVRLHDELKLEDFATGAFPVYTRDVPALVHALDTLARRIATGDVLPDTFEANISDNCSVLLWHDAAGRWSNFSAILRFNTTNVSAPLMLAQKSTRKQMVRQLKQLSDYLRNNKAADEK